MLGRKPEFVDNPPIPDPPRPRKKAGRPKGSKSKDTLIREMVQAEQHAAALADETIVNQVLRTIVREHIHDMARALVERAKGVSYAVIRQDDGSFARATDEAALNRAIEQGNEIKIYTQEPHPPAFEVLTSRAFGKPYQAVGGKDGGPVIISWESD